MKLPERFQFSQSTLQDFDDCYHRFKLRYLDHLAWPAVESEPFLENEQRMQQGSLFHRMVQQSLSGIAPERLAQMASSAALSNGYEDLPRWWQNFLESAPAEIEGDPYPETLLVAPLGNHRLVAKFDLVVMQPDGKALILDWKTSKKRPRRSWLAERMQSRVYPYVLACAAARFNQGQPVKPDDIEMTYWFAEHPQNPESFVYSRGRFEEDRRTLLSLIEQIESMSAEDFFMTAQEERCRFCVYRSYCDRGAEAGNRDELDESLELESDFELDFDFEQIAEIEF